MTRGQYLLKQEKDDVVVYEGTSWDEVLKNVKKANKPAETIWYNLLAIQVTDEKTAQLVAKRLHRYQSGKMETEPLGDVWLTLGDLEKLLKGLNKK